MAAEGGAVGVGASFVNHKVAKMATQSTIFVRINSLLHQH